MTTKPTRWLARQLGRRGAALMILGAIFVLVGIDALFNVPEPDFDRFLLHTFIPFPLNAALWLVPGGLAIWASLHRGPGPDGFGFNALVVPIIVRIVSYIFSFVAFLTGEGSWAFGLTSAAIWTAILALVLIIAGWAEVPTGYRPRRRPRRWKRAP
ncbi:membrane protein [Arthrobacter phage Tweety19]|uniref:Membrane protein n=1 Tax=Arthrobacter phage Tweety19 TaxID=2768133 RepID=A0A7G9W219_9CAUD|nr:membrane protein [Arthrobacter phage Tweety19]QNO12682.1 membrane protein [Arthrobacter phage Tweety19]